MLSNSIILVNKILFQLSAPSPTVNTKEAMKAVMGMFNQTLDVGSEFGWQHKPETDDQDFEAQFAAASDTSK